MADRMSIELDHFLILAAPGAPEANLVCDIGLIEGPANDHPGQGTANRRFFFPNTGLELGYVRDAVEAANGCASGLRIVDRYEQEGASPFGLIVRASDDSTGEPFPGWRYCPEYFEDQQCFHVGNNSEQLEEPLCVCMPPNLPVADPALRHANPHLFLTELRVSVPVERPSAVLQAIADCDLVSLRAGEAHRLEAVFNDGKEGQSRDLAPHLPLVLRW